MERSRAEIERLIEENIGLAHAWAARNMRKGAPLGLDEDDLLSLGLEAMHYAARRWDDSRGRYSTYVFLVANTLLKRRWTDRQRKKNGGGILVHNLLRDDEGHPIDVEDAREPLPVGYWQEIYGGVEKIWPLLSEKEARVIRGRFLEERTLDELGRELGVTKERIQQIQNKALQRCKEKLMDATTPEVTGKKELTARRLKCPEREGQLFVVSEAAALSGLSPGTLLSYLREGHRNWINSRGFSWEFADPPLRKSWLVRQASKAEGPAKAKGAGNLMALIAQLVELAEKRRQMAVGEAEAELKLDQAAIERVKALALMAG